MKRLALLGIALLAGCETVAVPDPRSGDAYERYLGALELSDNRDSAEFRYLYILIEDPDPLARDGAVVALGEIPVAEHVDRLKEALMAGTGPYTANTTLVRCDACRALGRLGGHDATAAILRALEWDESPDVRRTAALVLGTLPIGRPEMPALIKAVADGSAGVSYAAVRSLEFLTGQKGIGRNRESWQRWYEGKPLPMPRPLPTKPPDPIPGDNR